MHIGYLAAIVAASNAGGSGSVVGDTTTTMMWIDGVSPLDVFEAYVAAVVAMVIFGIPAAMQQQRYSPIIKDPPRGIHIDWARVGIVAFILAAAIAANVIANVEYPELSDKFPFIGAAVWVAILLTAPLRKPEWSLMPETFKGSVFPAVAGAVRVDDAGRKAAGSRRGRPRFGLGFVSAVFDNIPLTALALKQGGYDWGFPRLRGRFRRLDDLVRLVGGVALSNMYPEAKSVGLWLRHGWHVALAYVIGFAALLFTLGWQPNEPHKSRPAAPAPALAIPAR